MSGKSGLGGCQVLVPGPLLPETSASSMAPAFFRWANWS